MLLFQADGHCCQCVFIHTANLEVSILHPASRFTIPSRDFVRSRNHSIHALMHTTGASIATHYRSFHQNKRLALPNLVGFSHPKLATPILLVQECRLSNGIPLFSFSCMYTLCNQTFVGGICLASKGVRCLIQA